MRIPDDKIEEISQKADILEVIGDYVTLKRRGDRYWGLSPFKSEKTPSFSVSPDKGLWYCFSTAQGGTIFQFIMAMENLSFREAVEYLAEKVGVDLPSAEPESGGDERRALRELYTRVAGSFRYIFEHSDAADRARRYMARRRINDETLDAFGIGFAPPDRRWLHRFLTKKQYSAEFLASSGLFSRNYPEVSLFSNRVMFPIRNRRGEVVAFGGRALEDGGPKYINSPEHPLFRKRDQLYGIDAALPSIRRQEKFHLVEGYMDVISSHQAGITTAVAPLGTAFTAEQARLVSRYAKKGVLVFDPDQAGQAAAFKAAPILARAEIEGYAVVLPEGSDPADLLVRGGSEAVSTALSEEVEILKFLIDDAKARLKSPDLVSKELFPYITSISSAVRREHCLEMIADSLGLDKYAVQSDYDRGGRAPSPHHAPTSEARTFPRTIDLFLMLATLVNRERFSFVRKIVSPEDLEDENARSLWIVLEDSYRRSTESLETVLASIDDEALRSEVLRRIASEEFTQNADQIIRDAAYRIKQRSIGRSIERIDSRLRRLRRAEGDTSNQERELLEDKMFLDGELQKLKGYGR